MSHNNTPNNTNKSLLEQTPSEFDITINKFRVKILQRNRLIKRVTDISCQCFEEMSYTELEVKLELLEQKYKQFETIQSELENIDESQIEEDFRDKFEDIFCAAKAKIINKLSLHKTTTNPLSSTQINQHEPSSSRAKVSLPRLELPSFNGQLNQWLNFFNMFSVMVDKNDELSNVEKFQYLKSCLTGDASQLVQSLEVTANNYCKALDLLISRYDNKRYIFNSHIQEIFKIQRMSNPNVIQLRNFVDCINGNLRALQSFASKNQISEGIILQLIVLKLDIEVATKWEEEVSNNAKQNSTDSFYLPTWGELSNFLERRCQSFDIIATNTTSRSSQFIPRKQTSFVVSGDQYCNLCEGSDYHNPFKCSFFTNMDPISRYELVKRKGLCLNCLFPNHISNNCPSSNRCQHCRVSHHTLLHREKAKQNPIAADNVTTNEGNSNCNTPTVLNVSRSRSDVVLATALVELSVASGKKMVARALLDSASQLHFITERVAQTLHLPRQKTDLDISGIGDNSIKAYYQCSLTLKSTNYPQISFINAIILSSITTCQLQKYINTESWNIPANIKLADPNFNQPGSIDILLGASIFYEFLMVGQIKLRDNLPILQKTSLGWIVAGAISSIAHSPSVPPKNSVFSATILDKLNDCLEKFWTIEDHHRINKEENNNDCERYFEETTYRCPQTNKFVVRFPFKPNAQKLGESYDIALKRFLLLEKRLKCDKKLNDEYSSFINEYIEMNHMKLLPRKQVSSKLLNYIPHHCVIKNDSSTTRLRVVFDASCQTSNGLSLNDILLTGPTLQDDLFTILFRFRLHRFVLMADIEKMFRQVFVNPDDLRFQCILWRNSSMEEVDVYQLQTITYGTSCATFLATKCLQQLAKDNVDVFPTGAEVTLKDFYVDNLMTGANTIEEVIEIKNQVVQLLKFGGFPLRKFASNVPDIIKDISSSDKEQLIKIHGTEFIKALGLKWSPKEDNFLFNYEIPLSRTKTTKRKILSHIATFFDPLGWINPIIVSCKILMQHMWTLKLSWDESVPQWIATQWEDICQQMPQIAEVKIPRLVQINSDTEIHAFADASTKAYGACIYAVSRIDGTSSLLCAKSRVAPIKPITLPRLELSAALLSSELLNEVCNIKNVSPNNIHCWSDSSIALSWIKGDAAKWNQFVSNRVQKIKNITSNFEWHYCPTAENPADLVSRGVKVADLIDNKLWFEGPEFLLKTRNNWPQLPHHNYEDIPEEKTKAATLIVNQSPNIFFDFKYINNYKKTLRIFAYVNRFIALVKKTKEVKRGHITLDEENQALLKICTIIQVESFSEEYKALSKTNVINHQSKLVQLSPFIKDGLIRVGGRLQNSSLSFDAIHPIVLPNHHPFVRTLINHHHRIHMHAGTQTLNSLLRDRFWIIDARNTIRHTIHNCIICYRCRPQICQQIMGSLPRDRVEPSYPFTITGVDYCGPFSITHRIRGKQPTKVYIAVFICFTTKAIHMEVVMDLTTIAFIAALKRFIARRGKCNTIYSDNATNFVGANKELKLLLQHFLSSDHIAAVSENCNQQGIKWKFIPPRSPHFGGLWESAVKQAKYFLRRAVGTYLFSYDELQTVCCQAEAIVNSRPLTPMSSDPDDLRAITPSHFLIGRTAQTVPEPSVEHFVSGTLKRYQQIQWAQQHFWQRWQREYLNELQGKRKWTTQFVNLQPNDMVLVKEDNSPPMKWHLGRIVETIKGPDDKVRVVVVKTSDGQHKRAITKICKLPIN
ncbi:uncharacterized protein LOC119604511 [Lucilia sericata]|uniref:uncharacterized protein LOC119604511 n=1 Tax=Lucilia sericata TaxID=13632 RepID=UPI0018A86F87|nr:uncharacterized protein LOC119604511 [Lucilia sericata]